jgi:hypothetical protein
MIPMRRYGKRLSVSALLSVVLTVALTTSVLAVTWGTTRRLTSSGQGLTYPHSIVGTTGTGALTVYENQNGSVRGVYMRRTLDAGTSWMAPVLLSSVLAGVGGEVPSVASWGAIVDLVWLEGTDCVHGGCRLMYRRSVDGGQNWSSPRTLSRTAAPADQPGAPRVARRGDLVAVTWTSLDTGWVRARVSQDGGLTWAWAALAKSANQPYAPAPLREGFPVPAIGTGVVYVAYYGVSAALQVRRSIDNGVTWLSPMTMATNGNGVFHDLAATGSTAVVGWTAQSSTDNWSAYRRTTDKGAIWAAARELAPRSGPPSFEPTLTYRAGLWAATYTRCVTNTCATSAVYHRESTNGLNWGAVTRVSSSSLGQAFTGGVAIAGKQIVAFTGLPEDFSSSNVYARPSQ